ncbi:hypothetical protein HME9304_01610 [Flagellimonas maritima]|uniref:Four helix bundle protein n=1 Tax=Flagellimonas maritima TaxID=1383885 RepID=A0A2Z4LTJ6_9FLAO|nr:four helix bundle protein [Allomuricauda aurantiaca]AWX44607.1 hypothetical protein HME9304_01610 [Allomuricauda aurantiaca]
MMKKGDVAGDKSIGFPLAIIEFCELLEEKRKFVTANQLLKSGTSVGANIHEAQNAESRIDLYTSLKWL